MSHITRQPNMLTIVQANGAALNTDISAQEFQTMITMAAPSPWITINTNSLGTVILNTFTIAYFYDDQS